MKGCLIKSHSAGLGSLINNAMQWSFKYDNISVDWSEVIYGAKTWDSLFQPSPAPEEPFDTVCVYPESGDHPQQWLTWRWAGLLYQGTNLDHLDWRWRCHVKWLKHFKVLPEITAWVDRFVAEHFKERTICAQIRYHGHSAEQLPPHRSVSCEDYADAISKEIENADATVYVAAGDFETLEFFCSRFPGFVCHPAARRSTGRDTDFMVTHTQTEQDAISAFQEILLMSRCNTLFHSVSNMATAALYICPALKSVYLQ